MLILSFPTRLNHPNIPFSFHHSCSIQSLSLSPEFLSGKSAFYTRKGLMEERVIKIPPLRSSDGDDEENITSVFEQESLIGGSTQSRTFSTSDFQSILNSLSKWLVAGSFGAVVLWRHDATALWAAMGSIVNSMLSVALKRILNQERPLANVRSDPGMPSSHAQSIFFTTVFLIQSMVDWLGVNLVTLVFAAASLVFGSYLSWLRVSQRLHTISQVAVGAVLGSCFALLWFWSWDAVVSDAFNSFLWVRVSVVLGSAICCLGFLVYVILNWLTDDRQN